MKELMIMQLLYELLTTIDFMTAESAQIPYEVLNKVMSRIINEVRGVNRVMYDLTSQSHLEQSSLNNILEPRNAYFTGFLGSFYVW